MTFGGESTSHEVLAGGQLPPTVRSREGSPRTELGRDVFALRDIPEAIHNDEAPNSLLSLRSNTGCTP
jgi:hypothetical protein